MDIDEHMLFSSRGAIINTASPYMDLRQLFCSLSECFLKDYACLLIVFPSIECFRHLRENVSRPSGQQSMQREFYPYTRLCDSCVQCDKYRDTLISRVSRTVCVSTDSLFTVIISSNSSKCKLQLKCYRQFWGSVLRLCGFKRWKKIMWDTQTGVFHSSTADPMTDWAFICKYFLRRV